MRGKTANYCNKNHIVGNGKAINHTGKEKSYYKICEELAVCTRIKAMM